MSVMEAHQDVLLLVDTCGERGSVALVRGEALVAEAILPERAASAGLLGAVRQVLAADEVGLAELTAVGVVNGPGSFTGVRVGLAVAKGLCEAMHLRIAAVSRLHVMASAAGLQEGFAVLRAGRDQVYAREVREGLGLREQLMEISVLRTQARERTLVCAEPGVRDLLQALEEPVQYLEIAAAQALRPVQMCLAEGGSDLALVDANYVRDEEAIYARSGSRSERSD